MKLKNVLIVVKDIERARQFYRDLFGLSVVLDNEIIFRDSKRIYKPQKLSVSGVFLLSIIVFSCGETQKILYRKQRVNSR